MAVYSHCPNPIWIGSKMRAGTDPNTLMSKAATWYFSVNLFVRNCSWCRCSSNLPILPKENSCCMSTHIEYRHCAAGWTDTWLTSASGHLLRRVKDKSFVSRILTVEQHRVCTSIYRRVIQRKALIIQLQFLGCRVWFLLELFEST